MNSEDNPGTVHVRLIEDEVMAVMRDTSEDRLNADAKIMLAAIMFADDEGVAYLEPGQLSRWCANTGYSKSSRSFMKRRIDHLIEAGVLAPGSTLLELRSMVGRAAYAELEAVAA